MTETAPALACDLRDLSDEDRKAQLAASVDLLMRERSELVELDDRFELRFTAERGRLVDRARWVERESVCCPWIDFALQRSPDSVLCLRLRDSAWGGKAAIHAGLEAATAISRGAPVPPELGSPKRRLLTAPQTNRYSTAGV
ncbi:hypothetical protein OOT46_02890 [Aquabacterium sp. A7-Y]|uniref:hypothetical protein n=1 Tax=Aquabacterium sp. A7-Y TaxID=1349605 RepID=UPI00223DAA75|nr:hypothetical protein [Aquabacterium sp. A7-Y]MCW7536800.1 hypothetical protein [Aquabacterium sp. A7-Y]